VMAGARKPRADRVTPGVGQPGPGEEPVTARMASFMSWGSMSTSRTFTSQRADVASAGTGSNASNGLPGASLRG
jgi:hypothetical protein